MLGQREDNLPITDRRSPYALGCLHEYFCETITRPASQCRFLHTRLCLSRRRFDYRHRYIYKERRVRLHVRICIRATSLHREVLLRALNRPQPTRYAWANPRDGGGQSDRKESSDLSSPRAQADVSACLHEIPLHCVRTMTTTYRRRPCTLAPRGRDRQEAHTKSLRVVRLRLRRVASVSLGWQNCVFRTACPPDTRR